MGELMNEVIIKSIRKQKGLTQKEVYSGIASKTFYSDFEAGKHSVEVTKFQGFLNNLGISQTEFDYFRDSQIINEEKILDAEIDQLYNSGNFEALYEIFEKYKSHTHTEIRYLAIKAYLLVLITNTNFYNFSRAPFLEILTYLDTIKMWTLKEIKLAKLVLLSYSEKEKDKERSLYARLLDELAKYEIFEAKRYYEEISDLFFNRIQWLLMINDIDEAKDCLQLYERVITKADNLYFSLQLRFMTYIVNLYFDFPTYSQKINALLDQLSSMPTSETHFYKIISQLHMEKAKNYYQRYQE
jgi:transcriptional regulator with XRE-family HTH domain